MRKVLFLIMILFTTTVVLAQQKIVNDAHAEIRNLPAFTGIKVSNGIELLVQQGKETAVAVSSDIPEDRGRIITQVEDGILKIYYKESGMPWTSKNSWKRKLKAYVSVSDLQILNGNSGAKIILDGSVKVNTIAMDISSGSSVTGSIDGNVLKINQSSGGVANMKGNVETIAVDASSGARFYGYELFAAQCKADASSGGKIEVTVQKEMSANASSGGQIYYKGDGTGVKIATSSGGKVNHIK